MCNIVEEYTAKRVAEGKREGILEGIRKGEHKALLNSIRSLMKKQQISAAEAMDALSIDKAIIAIHGIAIIAYEN